MREERRREEEERREKRKGGIGKKDVRDERRDERIEK